MAANLPEPETDMTPYTELLEQHCERLEAVEANLFDMLTEQVEGRDYLKVYELWLTAQNQLRLTAQSLNSVAKPKPRLAR
jgi:hypothetical protein